MGYAERRRTKRYWEIAQERRQREQYNQALAMATMLVLVVFVIVCAVMIDNGVLKLK